MTSFRIAALGVTLLVITLTQPWQLLAQGQAPEPVKGVKFAQISPADMQEWLTYLASDTLQGRQIFTEGYGLAAAYIADHLKTWGVKPLGDGGTYFQGVKLRGYRVTRSSSVTVEANGQTKTFKDGDHVTFAAAAGGKQTLTFAGLQFLGNGMAPVQNPQALKGALAVWMPPVAQPGAAAAGAGRGRRGGGAAAIQLGATAAIGLVTSPPTPGAAEQALTQAQDALEKATQAVQQAQVQLQGRGAPGRGAGGFGAGGGRGGATGCQNCDIPPTPYKIDNLAAPQFTGDEMFFETLLAGAPTKFADLKAKNDKGEAVIPFAVPGVKVTVNIDNGYEVVYEQLTRNVVGMIEGSDPKLKDTYVLLGAHLDHIGYSATGGGNQPSPAGCRRRGPTAVDAVLKAGKTPQNPQSLSSEQLAAARAAGPGAGRGGAGARGAGGRAGAPATNPVPLDQRDFISNGADDDGSGSITELAVAKAFATGAKPKRSIVFVWHAGEEAGLLGSHYNADFPVVPLDKVQAQLNMDMVGRDDCNNLEGDYTNTLFIVGDDRISTDLHNLIVEQNQTLAKPLTLDYELNDPDDPESVYTRSDHYSYAAKGIPIAFFTTGLHPDYHRVTDTVEKIQFPKMARIGQLVYETAFSIASTDKALERDNKGPRAGFGTPAAVIKK